MCVGLKEGRGASGDERIILWSKGHMSVQDRCVGSWSRYCGGGGDECVCDERVCTPLFVVD